MRLRWLLVAILMLAIMASALAVIYSKHQSRKLFVELQELNQQEDELNIEWGRLQLEQSAWSSHGRIEKVARKKLQMKLPEANEVYYLKP